MSCRNISRETTPGAPKYAGRLPFSLALCYISIEDRGANLIGDILKKRREELGLDLKEVAHTLRIQYEYLKALENNAVEKLPPAVYTRGYIREYARFLSVDPEPLVDEYASQIEPEENVQPEPAPAKRKPAFSRGLFVVPLIIAVAAAVIIFFPKEKIPSKVPPVENARPLADVSPPPLPSTDSAKVPPSADSVKIPPLADSTKVPPSTESSRADYVLNIIAAETTWLRIEMPDGKSEELLMKAGESKNWTSQKGFDLKLGNAGGVRLVFNGKDLGVPGGKGQVLRLKLPQDNIPKQGTDKLS